MNEKKRVYVDVVADFFHRGHLELIKNAKLLFSDVCVIVGVHSDKECTSYKREPIFCMEDRCEILRSCRYVDEVIPFAPLEISKEFISIHNIDVVAHGDDMSDFYKNVCYRVPIEMGIMKILPYYDAVSTTQIIDKVYSRYKKKQKLIYLSEISNGKWDKIIHKYHKRNNLNRENAFKNLLEVKEILDFEGLDFWLVGGTLLGIYRDGNFIKIDDDIDISVYEEEMIPCLSRLRERFLISGFIVRNAEKKKGTKLNLYKRNIKVSIDGIFLSKSLGKEYRFSNACKYPRKLYETFEEIDFNDIKFRVPSPIQKFLEFRYGYNWKIPTRSRKPTDYTSSSISQNGPNNVDLSNISDCKWIKHKPFYARLSDFDMEIREQNLMIVKRILDGLNLRFWLTNETLLGVYRDNGFIKWDDSVDLDLYEEDMLPLYDRLKKTFIKCGFIVRGNRKKNECKFSLFMGGEKIRLRGLYLDYKYKDNKYRLRKSHKYPRYFYEVEETMKFKGKSLLIPSPIEDFLSYVYGKKWNTLDKLEYTKNIKR